MSDTAAPFPDLSDRHLPDVTRLVPITVLAVLMCALPVFEVLPANWNPIILIIGVSVLVATAAVTLKEWIAVRSSQQVKALLTAFVENEDEPCFIADAQGDILVANKSAKDRFNAVTGTRLDVCLRSLFANPSAILTRLQSLAEVQGKTREDIVTKGRTVPMSAYSLGGGLIYWRVRIAEQGQWARISLPVLTLGRSDVILDMNIAARELIGFTPVALDVILSEPLSDKAKIALIQTPSGETRVIASEVHRYGSGRDVILIPFQQTLEGQYSTPFADLPVPVMRLSPTGEILETNRLAAKLVGETGCGETNIESIMHGLGHPVREWLAQTATQDVVPRSEFLRLSRKDKEVFVQVTLARTIADGQVGLIAVLNDATELKTLEAQFVQGQKMQAVGQLAGGVAHDFNNLLTAISGHCDLLLLRHDQSDPNYGDLVQINQNANRAAALVSQLLAFSRKQTLRPEVLDLRDTISDLIHLLNRLVGEKIRLTLSHDPVLKPVRADKRQLEQVLMNLVVNARDAMPEGGEIRIETEVLIVNQAIARDRATVPVGEYVTVKVIDSGVGIPADKLQKVFEPFYTTKRTGEGTGLGLSTAYGIVKQTGGFIFVDSIAGKGTEFTVFLPVCAARESTEMSEQNTPDVHSSRQGEGVVLLVEDEAPVRAFATRALRLKGFTVLEAESAEDALKLLEDSELNVDVFVTDVVMPGMDGPTWVKKAMETRPDVRVVFMSGYTEGAFGDSGPELPNSTFLPKPFSLNQLTEAVLQQLS
ncbi:ATP-binding protein [Ruegeria arenilitoris]|uniref:ATP-binding protein n=1 Tax=Ruegeria arenilitoris TaxID=1173585 RepID=UPI00147AD1EE|nr:ATP-binding protein [Ruegeria arenilitoris]